MPNYVNVKDKRTGQVVALNEFVARSWVERTKDANGQPTFEIQEPVQVVVNAPKKAAQSQEKQEDCVGCGKK